MVKALSVPATAIRGDEEVAEIRQRRAAAQQQQAEMMQAQQAAEAAGNAAPALRAVNATTEQAQ